MDEPLKPYTTFKVGGPARYFVPVRSADDIRFSVALAGEQKLPLFTLGGGSNILVSDRGFAGIVLHPVFKGIGLVHDDAESVILEVNAGEAWDDLVQHAVDHRWWGIENLSHIPGQAGAALVQNIGAYGQQISDVLKSVEVLELSGGAVEFLSAQACGLGYRRSIFNTTDRGRYIILRLKLQLTKHGRPRLDYPDVRSYFEERGNTQPSLAEIRQAIISIRDKKFPFPHEERGGNAGSFFKNPSLTEAEYAVLHEKMRRDHSPQEVARLEEIRNRYASAGAIKIPAAFLISICGLKGQCVGGAKVNETQPLVLINQGGATAEDVLALARHVRRTVYQRTGVAIEIEPELIGFTNQELERLYSLD